MSEVRTRVSVSIVVFQPDIEQLAQLLGDFRASHEPCAVTVVDNSAAPIAQETAEAFGAKYLHSGENLGYGQGHNLAASKRETAYDYHLVCNPDIRIGAEALGELVRFMDSEPDAGLVMPRILYPDGSEQGLCKLLPAPMDLLLRRFAPLKLGWIARRLARYELAGLPRNQVRDVPSLSGCFMLLRETALEQTGGFDPRFFLYMEDVDLCRRTGEISRTVFYPFVSVTHGYSKGSYNNRRLLLYHLRSAVQYFMKWGWFFDRKRAEANRRLGPSPK